MIEIFDRQRRRVAIAENAHGILEQQRMNAVWSLSFSLPCRDPKNEFCRPFYYVRHNGGELYRIMPEAMSVDEAGSVAYQCEHVLAALIDNVLFGYHVVGNLGTYTADVIRYILDHQLVKNWALDECDFRNQFEYGWEQESLLSALFSVATPLSGPYIWRTNTAVYPWRLSLKRLDTTGRPEMYVRRRHNMTSFRRGRDPQNIVTRLYPLGYGEGVNQLGIESVNGGIPYLQSPKEITDKYGIIERVWTDRRYEDPASLKAAAQAMLQEMQEPAVTYEVGYQEMTSSDFDRAAIGKRLRIVCPEIAGPVDTFITEIKRNYEDVDRSSIVVANKEASIASSLADMADRQRIEQTYAQGATQIYAQALQANGDSNSGAVMDFFIPQEMRIVNHVFLKVRLSRFRAYSKSTTSQDSQVVTSSTTDEESRTSSSGGGSVTSSGAGGGGSSTSSSGGGTTATSSGGGGTTTNTGSSGINVQYVTINTSYALSGENMHSHTYQAVNAHQHAVTIPSHSHSVTIPAHSHSFDIPSHSHSVTIPNHSHSVTIPGHNHRITIPAHSHAITPGIFEFGNPQRFDLYVNGKWQARFTSRTAEVDITSYLVGSDNRIPRGSWIEIEARPDDLAYISLDLTIQGFIQSRGDKTV